MEKTETNYKLDEKTAWLYSPLALAYVGDSIYELMVRTFIVSQKDAPVSHMHKKATRFVSARAQSIIIESIAEHLSDREMEIYRRGRNAKTHTMAKNMSVEEYKKATGFEALMGYLFITGQNLRLREIFALAAEAAGGAQEE